MRCERGNIDELKIDMRGLRRGRRPGEEVNERRNGDAQPHSGQLSQTQETGELNVTESEYRRHREQRKDLGLQSFIVLGWHPNPSNLANILCWKVFTSQRAPPVLLRT